MGKMVEFNLRHMPVVDEGMRPIGLLNLPQFAALSRQSLSPDHPYPQTPVPTKRKWLMSGESPTCADFLSRGAPGWRKVTLRFAGDAADGVVQAARLVARGFATRGFRGDPDPSHFRDSRRTGDSRWIPGCRFGLPFAQKSVMPRLVGAEGEIQGTEAGIQGLVLFRPVSLAGRLMGWDPVPGFCWMPIPFPPCNWPVIRFSLSPGGETPLEFHPVSFLNLPRDLDMDRNWRRTQRLLTPREQNRCRAFTPVG